jgi:hypothetical protein
MIIKLFLCFALMLCPGFAVINASAQDGFLSKDPPVLRIFNPEDNESVTVTLLVKRNYSNRPASPMWPEESPRVNLFFTRVLYTFPSRTPVRPQSVSFIILPRAKPKEAVSFSITADAEVVHQGEIVLGKGQAVIGGVKLDKSAVLVTVPTEAFLRLAQAENVEFKMGETSEKLNDYQRKAIAALAVTINAIGK